MKQYCWSTKKWSNDGSVESSIKKCIAEAKATYSDAKEVYIGEYEPYKPSITGCWLIEHLKEEAYIESDGVSEEQGWLECANDESYSALESDLEKEVNKVVKKVLKKHKHFVNFGTIKNQKKYKIN